MITLQVQPETEAKLLSQASAQGLDIELYLTRFVTKVDSEEQDLQEGLADIADGRTRPADEVFAELFERCGIQG